MTKQNPLERESDINDKEEQFLIEANVDHQTTNSMAYSRNKSLNNIQTSNGNS
jgi:hypothetical protein